MSAPAGGFCPNCGTAHLPGDTQCRRCGANLGAPEPLPVQETPQWVLAAGHPEPWRRLTACLLDLGACGLGALALYLMTRHWIWAGAWVLVYLLVTWVALALTGRTLGNAAAGLRAVSIFSGGPPGAVRAALRVLMFTVSMVVPIVGPIVLVLSGSWDATGGGRGWLERWSGTTMLHDAADAGAARLSTSHQPAEGPGGAAPDPQALANASPPGPAAAPDAAQSAVPSDPPLAPPPSQPVPPPSVGVIDAVPGVSHPNPGSDGPGPATQPPGHPMPVVIPPPESDAQVELHPPVGGGAVGGAVAGAWRGAPEASGEVPVVGDSDEVPVGLGESEEVPVGLGDSEEVPVGLEELTVAGRSPAPISANPGPSGGPGPMGGADRVPAAERARAAERHQVGPGASAPERIRAAETAQIPVVEEEIDLESDEMDYRGEEFVLLFDTSQRVVVGGNGLIGRNPTPAPGEEFAHIIPLHDPERSVSKTHLEFGIDEHGLWVRDRGSTNGTVIADPEGGRMVVGAGQKVHMDTDSVLFLGDRSMRIGLL